MIDIQEKIELAERKIASIIDELEKEIKLEVDDIDYSRLTEPGYNYYPAISLRFILPRR